MRSDFSYTPTTKRNKQSTIRQGRQGRSNELPTVTESGKIFGQSASGLTRDRKTEPVSREPIFQARTGTRKNLFPCSADHEQLWQPFPVGFILC